VSLLVLAAAAIVLTGCNSSRPYDHRIVAPLPSSCVPANCTAKAASVPAIYQHGDPAAGKHEFQTGPCASCHTLSDAGTHGTVGPKLDGLNLSLAAVVKQVVNGGTVMPAFKGTLSSKQIADVSAYVVQATRG
jgi:mono/diheme cytochrome c family protein